MSTPLTWDEVAAAVEAGDTSSLVFGPDEVVDRLERHGDLYAPVLTERQHLPGS